MFLPTLYNIFSSGSELFMIGLPGAPEMIILVFVVLLLFGGKKIPELMRGMGKGIREFNNARNTVKDELEKGYEEEEKKETK